MKPYILKYAKQVIAITAESTFERAVQAMSINAIDLWVKPISPSRVKHTLQQSVKSLSRLNKAISHTNIQDDITYESLFIDDQMPFAYPVYLLEPEHKRDLDPLRSFINQFDFYDEPAVFSKSDGIALVFHNAFPDSIIQAQRLLSEWENTTGRPLAIVVNEQGDGESLHQIYLKLMKVMETTFFTGYKQVIRVKEVQAWEDIDPFLTMEEQRDWVFMLDEGNSPAIKKWLYADFFDLEAPYPEPGLLRTRLTSILAQVRRFMIRNGITHSEDAYQRIFHRILYEPVLYRIVQNFILFLNDLFQLMDEGKRKVDIVEDAIAYMEKHYKDANLSLPEVAAYVGRSASYFSHLLSKKHKRSFSELLLYIRIAKAKELLESTDEAIKHIATTVGFNNPNYFSRIFKAQTGQAPRDWRQ